MTRLRIAALLMGVVWMAGAVGCAGVGGPPANLALETGAPLPNDGISGEWVGKWHSQPSGHEGSLRCTVLPIVPPDGRQYASLSGANTGPQSYDFRFDALWPMGFVQVPASYTITMKVVRDGDTLRFSGQRSLGICAGVYQCNGSVAGGKFQATYESEYDHGTFELTRAGSEAPADKTSARVSD